MTCLISIGNLRDFEMLIDQYGLEKIAISHGLTTDLIEKAKSFRSEKRVKQYLFSRILLFKLLQKVFFEQKKEQLNQLPEMVTSTSRPKPFFKDGNLPSFNISHSDDLIAVAINDHQSNIGLDLEVLSSSKTHQSNTKDYLNLAKHYFSQEEYQWLCSFSETRREKNFLSLWCVRESIIKMLETSVWKMKKIRLNPINYEIILDLEHSQKQMIYTQSFFSAGDQASRRMPDFHLAISSTQALNEIKFHSLSKRLALENNHNIGNIKKENDFRTKFFFKEN